MRLLILIPLMFLAGCATITKMSEKLFSKDCEVQVALADETVTTAFEAVAAAAESGIITKKSALDYTLEITGLRETLKVAGSQCPVDEDKAIGMANSVNMDALNIKEAL